MSDDEQLENLPLDQPRPPVGPEDTIPFEDDPDEPSSS